MGAGRGQAWLLPIGKVTMFAHRCGPIGMPPPKAFGRYCVAATPLSRKRSEPGRTKPSS